MMKVSICIPTYNQADYLELAINSALNQTFKPFEIIVSDDCSTDNTPEILSKLSLIHPVLKTIRQEVNLGIAKNVDSCLRMATGDYIIRLDSDDQLLPEYTEKLLELYAQYPEAGYAHAAVQEIDQSGNFLRERKLFRSTAFQDSKEALKMSIKGYRVAANIIMFKKEALIKVNYITGRPDYVEDYHLSSSISAAGFGNIYKNEILSYYRVWIDVGKVRQKRKILEITGLRRVFEDVIEPSYAKYGWNSGILKKRRAGFASQQADCLSWKVYSTKEKEELKEELLKLSSAPKVKFIIWAYLNGFENIVSLFPKMLFSIKSFFKSIILKRKSYTTGN